MSIKEITYKDYLITIDHDEDGFDPRDCDPFGTMVCFHKRYNLGDKHEIKSPNYSSWSEVRDYIEAELGGIVILPLYLYDHSGISMSVGKSTGTHASWDSGQVGFIYCTDGDMVSWKIPTTYQAELRLHEEVEAYDRYLRGDLYSYRVERPSTCDSCKHTSAELFEFSGNWASSDEAMKEAKATVDYQVSKVSA